MLSYVALGVIFFLLVLITAAIVALGSVPGKIARKRGHPWPDAVNAASWIGLATGVFWPVAFIWAYLPIPQRSKEGSGDTTPTSLGTAELEGRIAALEAALEKLQSQSKEGAS
jgi:uncharacterized BrkB/YihY/UPF0761 family membrane protein